MWRCMNHFLFGFLLYKEIPEMKNSYIFFHICFFSIYVVFIPKLISVYTSLRKVHFGATTQINKIVFYVQSLINYMKCTPTVFIVTGMRGSDPELYVSILVRSTYGENEFVHRLTHFRHRWTQPRHWYIVLDPFCEYPSQLLCSSPSP